MISYEFDLMISNIYIYIYNDCLKPQVDSVFMCFHDFIMVSMVTEVLWDPANGQSNPRTRNRRAWERSGWWFSGPSLATSLKSL